MTSFRLNDFLKRLIYIGLVVGHTVYNLESQLLLVGSGTATIYSPSNTKFTLYVS